MKTTIVKQHPNHSEPFNESKLYASIYASCLSVRTPSGEAETTAARVCQDFIPWLADKIEITSHDIRTRAAFHLESYNPHAAYMYQNYGIIH